MQLATILDRYTPAEIESFYANALWHRESLAELVTARALIAPDQVLLFDDTEALTFGELDGQAACLAAGLSRHGVEAGDRVAVQLPNWVEFATIVVALSRLGAIVVPMMPFYRRAEVGYILEHSRASMAITSPRTKHSDQVAMYRGLRDELPELRELVVVRHEGAYGPDVLTFAGLLAEGTQHRHDGPGADPDSPFAVLYSSGTTSRPKGCLHTVNTLCSSARALGTAVHYTEADVTFGPAPITHTQGIINGLMMPLVHGSAANIMEGFDPAVALREVEKHASTVAMTPPTMLQMMLDSPTCTREQLASIRVWMLSGAPVPLALLERAAQAMPQARLLSAYGRTENITTSICLPEDPPEKTLTTDGRPIPFVSVHVVDEQGNEVPRGREGDLAYKGPSHMLEYILNPEETRKLFTPDGYSRSGDLGYMDEDGYLRVSGRIKDIIIRGGMNISVRQIEDLLLVHPAISRVAVVGMPDDRLGERICCYIEPTVPGTVLTLDEVAAYLRGHELATQKLPERVEMIDQMPENATGKIQKVQLRAMAAELVR